MNKEMIISSNGHETRVAILEDDQLAELFVEREQNRGVVGNVYKGRVSKVLPGMQSSFVDIGLERDGFLYVSDVIANLDEYDKDDDDEGSNGSSGSNGSNGSKGFQWFQGSNGQVLAFRVLSGWNLPFGTFWNAWNPLEPLRT